MNSLAIIDSVKERELAALLGANVTEQGGGDRLPALKINLQEEDSDGNEIKRGTFFIAEQDEIVYSNSVTIRPLGQYFQWMHYDPAANKLANKTIQIPTFAVEARDMKGGVRCGKPTSKVLKDNPDLAAKYKDVTCFRNIYALVSYSGKTAKGEARKIENIPVVLRLKGANFSLFDEKVNKTVPKGHNLYNYAYDLSLKREKNGAVTYFVIQYDRSSDFMPLDSMTLDTMQHLLTIIKADNDKVEAAYRKALSGAEDEADSINTYESIEDLIDEDDDIPF